jgi:hypothetical protein
VNRQARDRECSAKIIYTRKMSIRSMAAGDAFVFAYGTPLAKPKQVKAAICPLLNGSAMIY